MHNSSWRLSPVFLAVLLAACPPEKNNTGGGDTTASDGEDRDGDGYGTDVDCDDTSAAIYPGALERCNGLDDNCDGQIDEAGATGGVTAYADADGDGWGADVGVQICPGASGYLYSSGDCDDSDEAVTPAATELCDGIDNDCDGLTDEPGTPDGTEYHLDQDGDGYGHPVLTGTACAPGDGYVEDATDCDDGDPSRNPGMPELCSNGIDDDCDGEVDEADATGSTWYADADGDNYGDDSVTVAACDRPDGYAHAGGDCDDTNPDIHPGACDDPSAPDGVDTDCSGVADDGSVCATNVGVSTFVEEESGTSVCNLRWDTTWNPSSSMCDDCTYGWDVDYAYNLADSTGASDCGLDETAADWTWQFSLDEDYAGGGAELWYAYYGEWTPVWPATVDAVGHLEFDATYTYYSYRVGWYGYADLDL